MAHTPLGHTSVSLLARAKLPCLCNVFVRIIWLPVKVQTNLRSSVNSGVWAENLNVFWKKVWEIFQKKKKEKKICVGKEPRFLHQQLESH